MTIAYVNAAARPKFTGESHVRTGYERSRLPAKLRQSSARTEIPTSVDQATAGPAEHQQFSRISFLLPITARLALSLPAAVLSVTAELAPAKCTAAPIVKEAGLFQHLDFVIPTLVALTRGPPASNTLSQLFRRL